MWCESTIRQLTIGNGGGNGKEWQEVYPLPLFFPLLYHPIFLLQKCTPWYNKFPLYPFLKKPKTYLWDQLLLCPLRLFVCPHPSLVCEQRKAEQQQRHNGSARTAAAAAAREFVFALLFPSSSAHVRQQQRQRTLTMTTCHNFPIQWTHIHIHTRAT